MRKRQAINYDNLRIRGIRPICVRVPDAVLLTGVGRTTFYKLNKLGRLVLRKVEGVTVVLYDDLERVVLDAPTLGDGGTPLEVPIYSPPSVRRRPKMRVAEVSAGQGSLFQ